jgi:hypothetical protein
MVGARYVLQTPIRATAAMRLAPAEGAELICINDTTYLSS